MRSVLHLRFCLGLVLSLALVAIITSGAGCGGGSTACICDPACPAKTHCSCEVPQGCVPDDPNAVLDLTVTTVDMAGGGCPQACTGATPYCNPNKLCVPCLEDTHCPMGQICKSAGQSALCIPGCNDDARCAMGQRCCGNNCIDTTKDVNNCGGCGNICGSQHSSARCVGGACQPGACTAGWGDCNMDPKDGCETSLRADPKNCTACGMVCDIKNAISGCSDTEMPACYIAACKYGFDDCNGDPKDGCETSVTSDVKNCGGCGMACPLVAHAKNTCQNSSCILTSCDLGFADCDGKPANGCEITTSTDALNCGACGNRCGQGLACINSSCTCQNCVIPGAKTKCVNLQCLFDQCLPGYANCDNNTQNGCEVITDSDPKNCGGCGVICPMNTPSCSAGKCVVGLDFGPMHTFTGLTAEHYITQGGCGVNNSQDPTINATYFCKHFYGDPLMMNCTPVPGFLAHRTPNCGDSKLHKNGGCTGNGNNIPNTTCDNGPCKIGNWNECTSGIANIVCHCQ